MKYSPSLASLYYPFHSSAPYSLWWPVFRCIHPPLPVFNDRYLLFQEPAQQDKLARLRHRLDQQQSKLNRLRLLRSQTDQSRANNATLSKSLFLLSPCALRRPYEITLALNMRDPRSPLNQGVSLFVTNERLINIGSLTGSRISVQLLSTMKKLGFEFESVVPRQPPGKRRAMYRCSKSWGKFLERAKENRVS